MNNVWILAQGPGDEAPSTIPSEPVTEGGETTTKTVASDSNAPGTQPQRPFSLMTYLPFILIFVVMYLLLFRGPRKKQQQHRQMLQTLEKNDRVRTIGGIIGTVVDVKDDEITLKIDESNNTKIKIVPSAIGKNMSKDKS